MSLMMPPPELMLPEKLSKNTRWKPRDTPSVAS
jgi:hypothetical protein